MRSSALSGATPRKPASPSNWNSRTVFQEQPAFSRSSASLTVPAVDESKNTVSRASRCWSVMTNSSRFVSASSGNA